MITNFDQVREIFEKLVEDHPPDQWESRLNAACNGDAELRDRVKRLIEAHAQKASPLDNAPSGLDITSLLPLVAEVPGSIIGPYKLLEQIGEGGFGVVFMAEQLKPIQRKVAVKIIKPGMDTQQVIARFEAERQALALMDHPNIAKVLDAGTTASGRPYFVMELVRGVPVTEFCDQKTLPVRDRLELFITICQAVQHAHQKGIIHRDIKPTNVLVTQQDGHPLAKVIDFGVAKATGQKLTEKTLFTGFAQLIGTPLYMSPEQAELSAQDVDTRTDIYSLGVLLYELLTGSTPFDKGRLKNATFDELRRIIREEEPPRPSTRLSTLAQEAISTVSTQRSSDPRHLSRLFQGELDWIVMKSLDKDRNRRYETAAALAADVEHYLRDEPVLASPPSARYRLRKFLRRNKGPVLAASLILLTLVGGIVGTTWGLIRVGQVLDDERQSRERADQQSELALKTLNLVVNDIQTKLAGIPAARDVRLDLLNTAVDGLKQVARTLNAAPKADRNLFLCYMELGDVFHKTLVGPNGGGGLAPAREQYEKANQIALKLAKGDPSSAEAQLDLANSYVSLGFVNLGSGARSIARDAFQRSLEISQKLAQQAPHDGRAQFLVACAYDHLGAVSEDSGDYVAARDAFQKAFEIFQKLALQNPQDELVQRDFALSYDRLGNADRELGDDTAAQNAYQKFNEIAHKSAQADPNNDGAQGDLEYSFVRIGDMNLKFGKLEAARDAYQKEEKIALKRAQKDPHNTQLQLDVAWAYEHLGDVEMRLENPLAARDKYHKASAIRLSSREPDGRLAEQMLADSFEKLANANLELGELSAASDSLQNAFKFTEKLAHDDPGDASVQFGLSALYQYLGRLNSKLGKLSAARDACQKEFDLDEKRAHNNPHNVTAQLNLAVSYEHLGDLNSLLQKFRAAREAYASGLDINQKLADQKLTDDDSQFRRRIEGVLYGHRGQVNLRSGDTAAARDDYQKQLDVSLKLARINSSDIGAQCDLADCYGELGHLEESVGDFPAAVRWFGQGIAILEKLNKEEKLAGNPDHQALLAVQQHAAAVCNAAPQAMESLASALAEPKEIVPELLGIRSRALARQGKLQEAAGAADKLASLELADGSDLFHAAGGFGLCADGVHTTKPDTASSPDTNSLEERYAARAVELLRKAQALGYFKDPVHRFALEDDHDFDVLRARDDFNKLLTANFPELVDGGNVDNDEATVGETVGQNPKDVQAKQDAVPTPLNKQAK